jgi:glutaredoxin
MYTAATLWLFQTFSAGVAFATDYSTAYARAQQGKPLVMLVSASWCGPCKAMRAAIDGAGLDYVYIDVDKEHQLASRLTGGNLGLPQLVVYRKTGDSWTRRILAGKQDIKKIRAFLEERP